MLTMEEARKELAETQGQISSAIYLLGTGYAREDSIVGLKALKEVFNQAIELADQQLTKLEGMQNAG